MALRWNLRFVPRRLLSRVSAKRIQNAIAGAQGSHFGLPALVGPVCPDSGGEPGDCACGGARGSH
jgi:hypothetical protein